MGNKDVDRVEANLCRLLDEVVYVPTKGELEGRVDGPHLLGLRKERFKGIIERELDRLR